MVLRVLSECLSTGQAAPGGIAGFYFGLNWDEKLELCISFFLKKNNSQHIPELLSFDSIVILHFSELKPFNFDIVF